MKTLYVLRHAKSSWSNPSLEDHDRPLAPRGCKAAPLMGQVLGSFENPPTLALTSSAKRAHHTAKLVSQVFEKTSFPSLEIQIDSRVYGASAEILVTILTELPNQTNSVVLIGHNTEIEELIALLCFRQIGRGVRMPTGALACMTFELNHWNRLQSGTGTLSALIFPRLAKRLLH